MFFCLFIGMVNNLSGQSTSFCGEMVKSTSSFSSGSDTAFFDRFGNSYSAAELDAFNYPDDTFLEDCNSGVFTLQFGVLIAEQDEALDDFYQQNQNSPLAKFTYIAREMAAVAEIADSTLVALEAGYADIHAKLDTLVLLEQGLPDDPTPAQLDSLATLKQTLGTAIVALHQTRSALIAGLQDDLHDAAATLVIANNSTVTISEVEENRRMVNMVALNKVVRGSAQFTTIELNSLQDVAKQCPLTGGNAVYEARSILAYTGEIPEYDDTVLCDSATLAEERVSPQAIQFSSRDEGYQFSAVPNPANDYLNILYAAPADAINIAVQLISLTGAIVTDILLVGNQGTQQIGLGHLPAGLYYLRFVVNGKLISVQKVVVAH